MLSATDSGRLSEEHRIIDYNYDLALYDMVYAAKIYEMLEEHSQDIKIERETAKFWV